MRDQADVVVVGAGIMGLSIAYHLASRGVTNVSVVDRGYLCGGASGRNGGGVRAQWSSEANVRLMQESIRMCREFASKMKINVWFRQGGYLFLARTTAIREGLEKSVALQNACGLPTRMLTPTEARRIVPELSTDGVEAASYCADDGVVFPWPFVWGYARAARKLGVEVLPFHDVVGFETRGARIDGVRIRASAPAGSSGRPLAAHARASEASPPSTLLRTHKVVNAAGAWAPEVAKLLGVALPNKAHRHEICSSEPLKPWLKPLVADLSDGLYFSQSTRGEIVGGIGNEYVPPGVDQGSSHAFLGKYARSLVRACPVLGRVKVLRQWAGCYDLTPDANPIVGPVDGIEHFYQASGFMGHGFMMAPVIGKLIADLIEDDTTTPLLEQWNLRRFAEGKLLSEAMIIG
jgi:sarcosine oxidase, subunit beta